MTGNCFAAIIFFFVSFYFGFQYCAHKAQADEAINWSRGSGVMDTVTMSVTHSRRSDTYTPHVAYHFVHNGKTYRGETISFPSPYFNNYTDSQSFQAKYAEGSIVSVYYNPKAPDKSCLEPGEGGPLNNELWTCFGTMFLAAILPFLPSRSYGYYGGGAMYHNPNMYITPSRY